MRPTLAFDVSVELEITMLTLMISISDIPIGGPA